MSLEKMKLFNINKRRQIFRFYFLDIHENLHITEKCYIKILYLSSEKIV